MEDNDLLVKKRHKINNHMNNINEDYEMPNDVFPIPLVHKKHPGDKHEELPETTIETDCKAACFSDDPNCKFDPTD